MKTYRVTVNGNQYDVTVEEIAAGQAPVASSAPSAAPITPPAASAKPAAGGALGTVTIESPLPGSIFKILAKAGEKVKKGQVIIIIEAMKMENEVLSPSDGTIVSMNVTEGATINAGDLLWSMS